MQILQFDNAQIKPLNFLEGNQMNFSQNLDDPRLVVLHRDEDIHLTRRQAFGLDDVAGPAKLCGTHAKNPVLGVGHFN